MQTEIVDNPTAEGTGESPDPPQQAHQRRAGTRSRKRVGSRAQVWHGTAHHTSGGLTKGDLMKKHGRLVSRRASAAAKR